MEFSDNKPIYRQIVDYSFNRIIDGSWTPGGRIPSVRELAAEKKEAKPKAAKPAPAAKAATEPKAAATDTKKADSDAKKVEGA